MTQLPNLLFTASQTRELDRLAIEEFGISANILMERAGDAAFRLMRSRWPEARRIAVFCGTGNNGGDGYVLARLAREQQLEVTVYQVGGNGKIQGDALAAMQRLYGVDVSPVIYTDQSLDKQDLIVDGLLGTGIRGKVASDYHSAINAINNAQKPVLALDVPSGINADTGAVCGVAVRASCTMCFIGLKPGLFTGSGAEYAGEVHFTGLNISHKVYDKQIPVARRLDYSTLKLLLPVRPRDAHKGDFGHVLIIGGDLGMSGAVRLSAEAALRCGAGLVSVATREQHAAYINSQRPEIMSHGVEQVEQLSALIEKASVIVIGPGLGQEAWAEDMLGAALKSDRPIVIDADALNILANQKQFVNLVQRPNCIFTPHPGEAARLLGYGNVNRGGKQIQADRFEAVTALIKKYSGVWLLKGSGTLVASDQGIGLCNAGNPGMASGGMGDVLSGVIAGFIAQQLDCLTAAQLGVCLHAEAGDAAVKSVGERGLLASDLMPWIRRLANPQ
ncbi:MAG: NAD(P)H-hydrate dehydratase [Gammaproteobacteria bacterium]|nr:NAD(P)H-hydrate dehydratase [Gammaproteobacteria bacterium]